MRILLVSSAFYPYPSGISEHVYYLARGLLNLGHEVKILTTNYPKRWGEVIEDLPVVRLGNVLLLPLNQSFATLPVGKYLPFQIKRFLSSDEFDIIHLHGCYPPEIGFWVLHFSRTINVCTFHTVGFRRLAIFKPLSIIFRPYANKLHGKIAVSKVAEEWISPLIPGEYRIIPNGIDIKRFSPHNPPIIKGEGPLILFVGRLDKRKGARLAIESFPLVKSSFPTAKLLIIGKGPEERMLRVMAEKEKEIIFLGYVKREELPLYYASCDVYISPALGGETFGIVLLEALATGKPVVCSRIPGYLTVIKDGENGLFFTPANPADLAEKIIRVLSDEGLRQRLTKNGLATAKNYSWERVVRMVEEYYFELKRKFAKR
uniref:Glycosyltransferase family 1 protein n=1 Tax=candidate division WOR-3 bacterium TaxID=2052148 RepID=A0A7C3URF5_UNCW3